MRVWRHKNTAYTSRNIQPTVPYGGGSVMVWGVSHPVVIAAAIPDAMLLPTDEYFAQEVPEPVYDGLACPKYVLWNSNPGSWLAKEQSLNVQCW
jgi:hypothetical protein